MSVFFRAGLAAVVGLVLVLAAGTGSAQEMRFPAQYFGRVDLPLPESKIHLEKLMDDNDNFEDIAGFSSNNRYRVMAEPVGRLDLLIDVGGQQGTATCTGWLIATDMLMTNYHCIPGHDGVILEAQLVMNYISLGQPQSEIDIYPVETEPLEADPDLDYAIVRVQGNPADKYGIVFMDVRDPEAQEELFIIHHPAGKPKKITRRNCRTARLAEGQDFHHYCDTLGGSSGSPIFSDNDSVLVGLHFAGLEKQYNMAKRLREIVASSAILGDLAQFATNQPPARNDTPPPAPDPAPAQDPPARASSGGAVTGEESDSGWGAITD